MCVYRHVKLGMENKNRDLVKPDGKLIYRCKHICYPSYYFLSSFSSPSSVHMLIRLSSTIGRHAHYQCGYGTARTVPGTRTAVDEGKLMDSVLPITCNLFHIFKK